jgi:hypothetical protein
LKTAKPFEAQSSKLKAVSSKLKAIDEWRGETKWE